MHNVMHKLCMFIVAVVAKHVAKEYCCALGWEVFVRDLTISSCGHVLQRKKSNKPLGDNDKKHIIIKTKSSQWSGPTKTW